ncbi:G2/mitotic-specific cyclin-2, partial [Tanacetum coccineum]
MQTFISMTSEVKFKEHAEAKANGDLIIVFATGFDRRNSRFTCEALA